jgi:hypothetical protein
MLRQRQGATKGEIIERKLDVGSGTFFSNFVMYFIILTTALTLHAHGIRDIDTSKQAAEALKPLAGSIAYTLYTVGLIGVGLLAIPTLSGSAAYVFAETFKWRQGLDAHQPRSRSADLGGACQRRQIRERSHTRAARNYNGALALAEEHQCPLGGHRRRQHSGDD